MQGKGNGAIPAVVYAAKSSADERGSIQTQLADCRALAEREALERVVYGAWWGRLVYLLRHALNRNTRRGSARTGTVNSPPNGSNTTSPRRSSTSDGRNGMRIRSSASSSDRISSPGSTTSTTSRRPSDN